MEIRTMTLKFILILLILSQFIIKTSLDTLYYKRKPIYFNYDYIVYNLLLTIFLILIVSFSMIISDKILSQFADSYSKSAFDIISFFITLLERGFLTYLYNYLMYGDKMSESVELPTFIAMDAFFILFFLFIDEIGFFDSVARLTVT